jgi:hypothetical protein
MSVERLHFLKFFKLRKERKKEKREEDPGYLAEYYGQRSKP